MTTATGFAVDIASLAQGLRKYLQYCKTESGDDGRGALVATRPSILESARPRVVVEPVSEVNALLRFPPNLQLVVLYRTALTAPSHTHGWHLV